MKSKIEKYLTVEKARELFEMRGPDVVWLNPPNTNRAQAGAVAGCLKRGANTWYRSIGFSDASGVLHRVGAHQISYALAYGTWPRGLVDHKDQNGLNNSPYNLRSATPGQNSYNQKGQCSNTGVKGVTYKEHRNKPYFAQLRAGGKNVFAKDFATLEEAIVAVRAARELHHGEFCNHG
jgi:hypothetical protein